MHVCLVSALSYRSTHVNVQTLAQPLKSVLRLAKSWSALVEILAEKVLTVILRIPAPVVTLARMEVCVMSKDLLSCVTNVMLAGLVSAFT